MKKLLLLSTSLLALALPQANAQSWGAGTKYPDHPYNEVAIGDLFLIEDVSPYKTQRVTIGTLRDWFLTKPSDLGFLVKQMDTTARDALTGTDGTVIYNTTSDTIEGRINGVWTDLGGAGVFDSTEHNDLTWGDNTTNPITWIFDVDGQDVIWVYSPGEVELQANMSIDGYLNFSGATIQTNGGPADNGIAIQTEEDGLVSIDAATFEANTAFTSGTGVDEDRDLLIANVTGTPTLSWDESEDSFSLSHGIIVNGDFSPTSVTTDTFRINDTVDQSHYAEFATANLTANRTFTLPGDAAATLIGSADTGTVTSTMIADGTVAKADLATAATAITTKIHSDGGSPYTVGTTDAKESYGGVIYVTTTQEVDLPAIAVGMSVTIICDAAVVVTVDPNGSEVIRLSGVDLTGGFAIKSSGAIAEMVVLTYHSAGKWYASTDAFATNES